MTGINSNEKGFTLIEVLMVVIILGIVLGIAATNLKGGADRAALNAQTNQLISDLRLLQTQASARQTALSFTITNGGNGYRIQTSTKDTELEREVKISAISSTPSSFSFDADGNRTGSGDYILELSVNGEKKKVKISPQGLVQAD